MRYMTKLDQDRLDAGWGRHCWIVDTKAEGPERNMKLMPEHEAISEARRFNASDRPLRF